MSSTARRPRRAGIEIVYQDLALCDNLDGGQNMYLGRESRDFIFRPGNRRWRADARTCGGASRSRRSARSKPVASLSGGQRQSVAIARAVKWSSRIVIFDKPTAALGVAQTRQVLELARRLGEQGLAVVVHSHNLHDMFEGPTASRCCGSAQHRRPRAQPDDPAGDRLGDHRGRPDEDAGIRTGGGGNGALSDDRRRPAGGEEQRRRRVTRGRGGSRRKAGESGPSR